MSSPNTYTPSRGTSPDNRIQDTRRNAIKVITHHLVHFSSTQKAFAYRILPHFRLAGAAVLRAIPTVARALRLPRKRIRSLSKWTEFIRSECNYAVRYRTAYCSPVCKALLVPRRKPQNACDGSIHPAFGPPWDHLHNEVFLARVPGARVLGPNGTVITSRGEVVEESSWGYHFLDRDRALSSWWLPKPERLDGYHYTIALPSSAGYSHWLLEALPRLFGLQELMSYGTTLIVNEPLREWQRESLELFGFGDVPILVLERRYLELENLYLPSYVGTPGYTHPWGCSWVRQRISRHLAKGSGHRRIFISRHLASRRRIINQEELLPILHKHGFETVEAELLSLKEQIHLFSEAEAVAAAHGAGLANLLFAPSECKVLEIYDPNHMNTCFYCLADVLNQRYLYLLGKTVRNAGAQHAASGHDDIYVPARDFDSALNALLDSY